MATRTRIVLGLTAFSVLDAIFLAVATYLHARPFQFAALWLAFIPYLALAVEYGYAAAAYSYELRVQSTFQLIVPERLWKATPIRSRGHEAALTMGVSYAMTVLLFGCIYRLFAAAHPGSIDGISSMTSAIYFSTTTALTIGLGDIHPVTDPARLIVIAQGAITLVYGVLLLSVLPTTLRESRVSP